MLFGQLAPFGAQLIGLHAQRGGDAGAEAFGLDQHGHQGVDILDARAQAQVAQGALLGIAGAQFQRQQMQFLGQHPAFQADLGRYPRQRRIHRQARLHADGHQVECVGKRFKDLALAQADAPVQPEIGQVVAEAGRQQQPQQQIDAVVMYPCQAQPEEQQHGQADGQARLGAEVQQGRRRMAQARMHEAQAYPGRFPAVFRQGQAGQRSAELDEVRQPLARTACFAGTHTVEALA